MKILRKLFFIVLYFLSIGIYPIYSAEDIEQNHTNSFESAEEMNNLSLVFLANKQVDSAMYYVNLAFTISNEPDELFYTVKCYNSIAEYLYYQNNFKAAYDVFQVATQLNDSLINLIYNHEKEYQEAMHLSRSQKNLIQNLTQENIEQDKTIKKNRSTLEKQKVIITSIVVILALIISLILLLWKYYKKTQKAHRTLTISNKQIAQQKEEIEVQKQHLQDVNTELEKLSIVASETDNGIRVMNAVGRVLWINEGYTKMHGFILDDLQSIDNYNLLGDESDIDLSELVNVWYGDKKPITFQSLNKTKEGSKIWVQTTLTPILNDDNKIDKMIAIDSDITRLKKAEEEIITKNQDITASIAYAKRIQQAMITPFSILSKIYPKSFNYYKPKSIVSGDFYWISETQNKLIVACADGTGHGVPGAFISLIGISFLNKIVNEKGFISPSVILNRLRMNIINHLRQTDNETVAGDGIDMSIICIDKKNYSLEYAGAMNPIYIVRGGDFIELKPDRMPVGFFDNEDRPFSSTCFTLKKEDQLFMFTDGYYDQFGGENGAKMKTRRFKEILEKTLNQDPEAQKQIIHEEFNQWKAEFPQVDDVLVMGLKID